MAKTGQEMARGVLNNPSVHTLTKDIIRMGMNKDCVDAYYDVLLAAKVLKQIMCDNLYNGDTRSVKWPIV